jgi:hypothetical protein
MVRITLYLIGLGGVLAAVALTPHSTLIQEAVQPEPVAVFNDDLTVRSPHPVATGVSTLPEYLQAISGGGQ